MFKQNHAALQHSALFIIKHVGKLAILLLVVSFVSYALVALSPIDPVAANVGQAAYLSMSEVKREQLAHYWGVSTPFVERYLHWVAGILQGDWGISLRFNAPVLEVITQRAGNTLALMSTAWIVSGVLGFGMGILAACKRHTWVDKLISGYCFVLASVPSFWLALMALMVFAVELGWFPFGFSQPIGKASADISVLDLINHIILPALTLSVTGVANIALHTRQKALDVLQADYMRYARLKGLSESQALLRHGLRNLSLPAITLQFASIAEIFSGSVLVEQVFSYPGLGSAAVVAGLGGDAALLVGIALISAALVFAGNLCANILYGVIDPRIRRG